MADNILVTGGTGFLGHHLIQALLAEGHTIYSLQRQPSEKTIGTIPLIGDLNDLPQLIQPHFNISTIFHIAAKAGIWGPYHDYYDTNVLGTKKVIDTMIAHRIPYLIYTSTASVVFNRQAIHKGTEAMPYGKKWLCHYAKTKAIAEKMLLTHKNPNFKRIALRPHLIWGPGDPHLFPRLIQQAKKNQLTQIGKGENWVDLTHVDNVVHGHLLAWKALKNNIGNGEAYFITQNEPVILWPWIKQFLKDLGLPLPKKKLSSSLGYAIGYILEKIHTLCPALGEPRLTRFLSIELSHDHTFSSEKAKKDLGYQPIKTFADGMSEALTQMATHLNPSKRQ